MVKRTVSAIALVVAASFCVAAPASAIDDLTTLEGCNAAYNRVVSVAEGNAYEFSVELNKRDNRIIKQRAFIVKQHKRILHLLDRLNNR